jgi:hypothetical protein
MAEVQEHYSVLFVVVSALPIVFLGYLVNTVYYNLYRHPLAHVPGPKLAGATFLYQTYFCLVGGSRYYKKIAKLHEQYGISLSLGSHDIV